MLRPFAFVVLLEMLVLTSPAVAAEKPNVLVIYLDDMGWAQPSCYGGKLTPTPNIDALAAGGARFTDGYVSACVCSPSRVGLMTGRYQQRTGHDANSGRPGRELDLKEVTFAQHMKAAGYVTGIVGKWHLGETKEYLPASRGFDESFGTVGNLGEGEGPLFYRGLERVADPAGAPVTSPIYRDEAIRFIEKHRSEPWFLYLPFNAVHSPVVYSDSVYQRLSRIEDKRERAYAALLTEADDTIGSVMAKLRELKLEENTLIFCISDNGGANAEAELGGLRGRKWFVWEGGIRVCWIAQWKGRIPAGQVVHEPVIQLDVLPTALAAAGAAPTGGAKFDGVSLLPLLEGKTKTLDHEALYWRFGVQYAVRQGDWKLVKAGKDLDPMLVNLTKDPGEQTDLSNSEPEKAAALKKLWDGWNSQMAPPRWEDLRWNGDEDRKTTKPKKKAKRSKAN